MKTGLTGGVESASLRLSRAVALCVLCDSMGQLSRLMPAT